jgi:hypothetical protein
VFPITPHEKPPKNPEKEAKKRGKLLIFQGKIRLKSVDFSRFFL